MVHELTPIAARQRTVVARILRKMVITLNVHLLRGIISIPAPLFKRGGAFCCELPAFFADGAETELQGEDEIDSSAGGCSGLIGQVFYNPIRNQGGQNPEQTAWQHNDSKRNDNG